MWVTVEHLSHLPQAHLRDLAFAGVVIGSGGIAELSNCTTLKSLSFADCELKDDSVAALSALGGLEELVLPPGCPAGAVHVIRNLNRIELLNLGGVSLPPQAADVIAELSTLKRVCVVGTGISATDVAKLRKRLPDAIIAADSNAGH